MPVHFEEIDVCEGSGIMIGLHLSVGTQMNGLQKKRVILSDKSD